MAKKKYDVFLSHAHTNSNWVENIAKRLEDEEKLNLWLDKWVIISGSRWQQAMAKGIEEAKSCAVFWGVEAPRNWFRMEMEAALDRQANQPSFRVIPVLLPGAISSTVNIFLRLNSWVDFRSEANSDYAFHLLLCGIKGVPPGRWEPKNRKQKA